MDTAAAPAFGVLVSREYPGPGCLPAPAGNPAGHACPMPTATPVSLIFAGIEAELADLFGLPVYRAKRPVAAGKPPAGGWNPGWQVPCFVVSVNEAEAVDEHGDFEQVSVRHVATVEYVKPAHAAVAGAPALNGTDPALIEDDDVRAKRDAVRQRIYKPRLGAVPNVIDATARPGRPYDVPGAGAVVASGQAFGFEVGEPRAE
jgi:hypothetical protein